MKNRKINLEAKLPNNRKQWKLHQELGRFSEMMQRTRDAGEAVQQRRDSSPLSLLPMVF